MAVTTHYIDNSWKLRNHMIRFLYVPAPHTSERLAKFLIDSLMDWNVDKKLAIFNDISVLFSGNNYPTVNLFFPRICELKLKLLEWRLDSVPVIRDMAESMWLKFTKYWSTIHIVLAISVILDPRYKFDLVEYYALKFGVDASFDKEVIKTILYDLVREYQMKLDSATVNASSSNGMKRSANDHDFEMYVSQRKRSRISTYKTELDHYLTENIIPFEDEFDLLVWWQQNGPKYPMLQGIARDLLAIPITSVASEAAFSAGGRLLDPHRSRLNSVTVEAMMCTHSWIQDSHNSGMILVKVNVFVYYLICVDSTNQVLLFCCSKQSREMKKMEL
ncbi:Putative AC transposase [Linum grandiflorum]